MTRIFETFSRALEGSPATACAAAFVWGMLSILLSPCHLTSLPLVVAYLAGRENLTFRRALLSALCFALGILATLVAIGAITAAAGRMMGNLGPWANYVVAVIFFLVGLHLLGAIPLPGPSPGVGGAHRRGPLGALLLGLIFGVALGPCAFAFMAPILGVVFRVAAERTGFAVQLLALYAAGHCLVLVIAGCSVGLVQRYLNWNERSRGLAILRGVCGTLIILGGCYLIYKA